MKIVNVTYGRAIKFFWALMWRSWIVIMPVMVILGVISFLLLPPHQPGQPAVVPPGQLPVSIGVFFLIWLSMMSSMFFLQLVALRWTFKTKWSDFYFVAVSPEEEKKSE